VGLGIGAIDTIGKGNHRPEGRTVLVGSPPLAVSGRPGCPLSRTQHRTRKVGADHSSAEGTGSPCAHRWRAPTAATCAGLVAESMQHKIVPVRWHRLAHLPRGARPLRVARQAALCVTHSCFFAPRPSLPSVCSPRHTAEGDSSTHRYASKSIRGQNRPPLGTSRT
jgi:hypothetical protein